jgi:hypothetical protein
MLNRWRSASANRGYLVVSRPLWPIPRNALALKHRSIRRFELKRINQQCLFRYFD